MRPFTFLEIFYLGASIFSSVLTNTRKTGVPEYYNFER